MRAGVKVMGVVIGLVAAGAVAGTAVVMTGAGLPGSWAEPSQPATSQSAASSQSSAEASPPPAVQMAQAAKSSRGAADRKTVTMQYGGWKVTCEEGGQARTVCSAAFRIIDRNTNGTILTWLVGRGGDDQLLTEFFVPTEVLIKPGVTVSLEEGPSYTADFVACGQSACKASLPLDPALVSELAAAKRATLSLTASDGKVTRFSMGIEGIESALAELE